MDKDTRIGTPVVGGSSLLVIFAVLCLTVFALLGLSTVQAGGRLTQTTAQAVSAYYQADCQAEELFARLRGGEMPEGVNPCGCSGEGYTYSCPISHTQQLCVELHVDDEAWTVVRWQAESIADWEADESLNVWDGT